MADTLKVACVQMNAGPDIADNLKAAEGFIREAAGGGAQLIATPENTCHMRGVPGAKLESAPYEQDHPGIPLFGDLAKELGVWLLIGSMSVKLSDTQLANRSYLFSDSGDIAATYDKIHMFDVDLEDDRSYRESKACRPGDRAVVTKTPWGGLGMSICYDVRFPHLYRDLAKNGADILAVPAAFTVPTGQAHWEVLLRARAIETGVFVLAPGQTGEHEGGRKTWGHSMIINPWGEVLADAGSKPGIITADLNMDEIAEARKSIPALQHDRAYSS